MLTAGTVVKRKRDCSHRPNALAEIMELDATAPPFGGSTYVVRVLGGTTEYWNSNYFTVEQPKEPDWEI